MIRQRIRWAIQDAWAVWQAYLARRELERTVDVLGRRWERLAFEDWNPDEAWDPYSE